MADLKSLIRLRRHRVEDKQKVVADLYRQAETFEARKASLLERLQIEREAMEKSELLDTRAYYGRFADGVRKTIAKIDSQLAKLEVRIRIAQDDMREAFADAKRVEIVQRGREEREKQAAAAKESRELDEIGIEGFRRKDETQ